jgi:hypothetical protein
VGVVPVPHVLGIILALALVGWQWRGKGAPAAA